MARRRRRRRKAALLLHQLTASKEEAAGWRLGDRVGARLLKGGDTALPQCQGGCLPRRGAVISWKAKLLGGG